MEQNNRKILLNRYTDEANKLLAEMARIVVRAQRKKEDKTYRELLSKIQ